MKNEKIIKRRDGSRVKIVSNIYTDSNRVWFRWESYSYYCAPGKRTFKTVTPSAATPEEMFEAEIELWNLIKPKL